MQVKEYKSPEEALKEVKDPIIRSAIEPLSDRVAKMIKNGEILRELLPLPRPSSNISRIINSIDDVIEILMHYKKMLNKAYLEIPGNEIYHRFYIYSSKIPEPDEYLFIEEIDYLHAKVNAYLNLDLYKPLPHFQKLVDYYSILNSARKVMEDGYADIVSRTSDVELLSADSQLATLLEIAIDYKAEEHEGKQD